MSDSPHNSSISALCKELECYRRLLKLSDRQRDVIHQNQTDELMAILEHRSAILSELSSLQAEVAPLRRNWAELSSKMEEEVRQNVQSMLAETRLLLEQITAADQDDVMILQQRKLNVGKQLHATTNARVINRKFAAAAYGNSGQSKLNIQQ